MIFSTESGGPSKQPTSPSRISSSTAAAASTANSSDTQLAVPASYHLQATGRYAHPGGYLRQAAEQTGWRVVSLVDGKVLRFNAGKPIYGNICALQWPRC